MLPSNPRVLTCPKCKGQKEVMTLMSGNTIGATYWSDTKREAPMLPGVSVVQKCPHCGYYYFTNKQPYKTSDKGYSFELGTLSFDDCKEALAQCLNESLSSEDETTLRMYALFAFNDRYHRHTKDSKPNDDSKFKDDFLYFKDNALRLIELYENDDETVLFRAELYREIEMYKECLELIDSVKAENDRISAIKNAIKEHAEMGDNAVFRI